MTIYRFPKILVIHLKRFYHSSMRREKLNTTVSFPETLDVSAYAPHSSKLFHIFLPASEVFEFLVCLIDCLCLYVDHGSKRNAT